MLLPSQLRQADCSVKQHQLLQPLLRQGYSDLVSSVNHRHNKSPRHQRRIHSAVREIQLHVVFGLTLPKVYSGIRRKLNLPRDYSVALHKHSLLLGYSGARNSLLKDCSVVLRKRPRTTYLAARISSNNKRNLLRRCRRQASLRNCLRVSGNICRNSSAPKSF